MSSLIQLLDRPIAYNPALAKLKAGKVRSGPVAAVFLSQLIYWHNRMDGDWMYKTRADITTETALTRDEQETARKRLVSLGVLEEKLRGVPATMHYRINTERLEALLLETTKPVKKTSRDKTRLRDIQNVETPQSGLVQPRQQDCGNTANKNVETPPASMGVSPEQASGNSTNFLTGDYTENTQKITQETTQGSCPVAPDDSADSWSDDLPPADPPPDDEPAQQVLDHFNQVTRSSYRDGKTTMGYIRGRLADMYSPDDLILVADYATAKWASDTKMRDYLRPKTLFGPENFQEYYQKALKWQEYGRPAYRNGRWQKTQMLAPAQNTIPDGFTG